MGITSTLKKVSALTVMDYNEKYRGMDDKRFNQEIIAVYGEITRISDGLKAGASLDKVATPDMLFKIVAMEAAAFDRVSLKHGRIPEVPESVRFKSPAVAFKEQSLFALMKALDVPGIEQYEQRRMTPEGGRRNPSQPRVQKINS